MSGSCRLAAAEPLTPTDVAALGRFSSQLSRQLSEALKQEQEVCAGVMARALLQPSSAAASPVDALGCAARGAVLAQPVRAQRSRPVRPRAHPPPLQALYDSIADALRAASAPLPADA